MARFGFSREDYGESDAFGVWPENWQAFGVFMTLGTQWRIGMSGPTGIDYAVLNDVFRLNQIPKAERPDTFAAIRVMEDAALRVIHEKD
ncbi:DUF1799 domain-containing protein [Pseudomonas sp. S9]|uniref:DUF1799 domain-containing protein n=1 Tax=Pseudomonas sp. S9 TaxID=686578 RepID=UPI0004982309|nr:DUF1799 domain-containing protein [Pseudomonas sp. S9]